MTAVRYRWDVYALNTTPGPWRVATPGKLARACRALAMPTERLRIEYDNGQQVVVRLKGGRYAKRHHGGTRL